MRIGETCKDMTESDRSLFEGRCATPSGEPTEAIQQLSRRACNGQSYVPSRLVPLR
jgi:hypothetical protein